MALPGHTRPSWTFFTNHAHVLIAISRDPGLRQRDIAQLVGITEGAVQRILHDLEAGGYLRRERIGRRNRYHVEADQPLRHPLESDRSVDDILRTVNEPAEMSRTAS
ncbi:MAG: helix-turn-helix domain-containing protein [Ilumatobacter sp.]|uniref:MarR family transcriptional regulator n=1 Tax=Ilumatobacter sp. TaxID=1967498 RepID=UPI00262C7D71|nr:helix-turn-helix domain-containing protein [Ilumatobacter sp.]MDJ0769124.1 helix-turn-helix domain-containing protein [Ilumatobacter sp.]